MQTNGPEADTEVFPINQSGQGSTAPLPPASAKTLEIGASAFGENPGDGEASGGKKRGRPITSGKYAGRKRAKRGVPLAKVANGSSPLLLEEEPALAPEIGTEAIDQAFNEEINRKYAGLILGMLVALTNAVKRNRITKSTGDKDLAQWVIEHKKIGEAPKEAIETGLVECARKYGYDLSHSPEGMLIGGILLWQAEDAANTSALIAEFKKISPQTA